MNTETVKEEIVYFNEQVVYEEGELVVRRKDKKIDPTECEGLSINGKPIELKISSMSFFTLFVSGRFNRQTASCDLHLLDDGKQKEAIEEIVKFLLKSYEKWPDGRPKKEHTA